MPWCSGALFSLSLRNTKYHTESPLPPHHHPLHLAPPPSRLLHPAQTAGVWVNTHPLPRLNLLFLIYRRIYDAHWKPRVRWLSSIRCSSFSSLFPDSWYDTQGSWLCTPAVTDHHSPYSSSCQSLRSIVDSIDRRLPMKRNHFCNSNSTSPSDNWHLSSRLERGSSASRKVQKTNVILLQ